MFLERSTLCKIFCFVTLVVQNSRNRCFTRQILQYIHRLKLCSPISSYFVVNAAFSYSIVLANIKCFSNFSYESKTRVRPGTLHSKRHCDAFSFSVFVLVSDCLAFRSRSFTADSKNSSCVFSRSLLCCVHTAIREQFTSTNIVCFPYCNT